MVKARFSFSSFSICWACRAAGEAFLALWAMVAELSAALPLTRSHQIAAHVLHLRTAAQCQH